MSNFAQTETQLWQEHQERLKARDVAEISRENNALFIHNFANLISGGITVFEDRKNISLVSRINSILGLSPDLSSSTIRLGYTDKYNHVDQLWNRLAFGFILKGGSVTNAGIRDKSTHSVGLRKTSDANFFVAKPEVVRKEIREAIKKKPDYIDKESPNYRENLGYNELVVHNPEIGGFIIQASTEVIGDVSINHLSIPIKISEELKQFLLSSNMPLYGRFGADVIKIDYDETSDSFKCGEKVSCEDIQNNGFQLSEEQKRQKREEIFAECPFRLNNPEKMSTNLWKQGAEMYEWVGDPQKMEEFSSHTGFNIWGEMSRTRIWMNLFTDRLSCIESFAQVLDIYKYNDQKIDKMYSEKLVISGEIRNKRRMIEAMKLEIIPFKKQLEDYREKGDKQGENYTSLLLLDTQKSLVENEDELLNLLKEEENLFSAIEDRKKELEIESVDEVAVRRQKGFEKNKEVLCSLYGFVEAARQAGDTENYKKALELFRSYDLGGFESEISEILERRLGKNPSKDSPFRITEEDLGDIVSSST